MTDAVKGVTAQPYEDGQYRRSRLDRTKARGLRTSDKNRSVFKKEKTQEYKENIPELTNRQAKKFGKKTMQNERTAARVDDRMVYIDENKYEAGKKALKDFDHVLIGNDKVDKNVRKMIAENPEDFYINGEFSSDQFKRRVGGYTGFDNKGNLDEIATMASDYDISKRATRRAMKYAGYERETDLTILYKTLAGLGVLGASAGVGAIVGSRFTSNVHGIHNDGSSELLDTIKSDNNATEVGALRGLLAGVLPAAAAVYFTKDKGYADIFKGNTAEEIVAKGELNIESRIKGDKNQKMMKAILKMENISDEDKALILKLAYGELTGKKVNDRELVAAYEIANYCNKHPEEKVKNYDKLPGTLPPVTTPDPDNEGGNTPPVDNDDNDNNNNNNNINGNNDGNNNCADDKCQLSVLGNGDGIETVPYKVVFGDDPYRVTKGLYKRADGKPMTHNDIMALRNDIFGKNKGLRVGTIELPKNKAVNGIQYVYEKGEVEQTKPVDVKLDYYDNSTKQGKDQTFRVEEGCGNTTLQTGFKTKEEAVNYAKQQVATNPNKYLFLQ